jgi:hypothetical protein
MNCAVYSLQSAELNDALEAFCVPSAIFVFSEQRRWRVVVTCKSCITQSLDKSFTVCISGVGCVDVAVDDSSDIHNISICTQAATSQLPARCEANHCYIMCGECRQEKDVFTECKAEACMLHVCTSLANLVSKCTFKPQV